MRLLPHDASFFAHFEHQGKKTVEGCRAFLEMVEHPTDLECARRAGQADRARVRRRSRTPCVEALHKTFITPIDRDDIYRLITQDGRHHGLRRGGRRAHRALRDPDDDRRRSATSPTCCVEQRRARAGRGVGHARPQEAAAASSSTASRSTAWRTRPTASCAARWRAVQARRRTRSSVIKWKEIYESARDGDRPLRGRRQHHRGRRPRAQPERRHGRSVVAIVVIALVFDFINGFHDAANSIATVVSTRVLSPRWR